MSEEGSLPATGGRGVGVGFWLIGRGALWVWRFWLGLIVVAAVGLVVL